MELLDLDNDALEYIYTKLNWRDLWNLSTTCNRFRFLYPHIEVNQAKLVKQAMRKIKEIDYSIYIDMYGIQKSERMQENIVVRYDFTPGISYQLRNEFGHEDENLSISYYYINDDQKFLIDYLSYLEKKSFSPATVRNYRADLKQLLNFLSLENYTLNDLKKLLFFLLIFTWLIQTE